MCLAAELSRQEENSGGWLKSTTGARLPSKVRDETEASLIWSGDCGWDEDTRIFMIQGTNTASINLVTRAETAILPAILWCASGLFRLYLGQSIYNWLSTGNVLEYPFRAHDWVFKRDNPKATSLHRKTFHSYFHQQNRLALGSLGVEEPAVFVMCFVMQPSSETSGCRSQEAQSPFHLASFLYNLSGSLAFWLPYGELQTH